jgi:hypothetical protein
LRCFRLSLLESVLARPPRPGAAWSGPPWSPGDPACIPSALYWGASATAPRPSQASKCLAPAQRAQRSQPRLDASPVSVSSPPRIPFSGVFWFFSIPLASCFLLPANALCEYGVRRMFLRGRSCFLFRTLFLKPLFLASCPKGTVCRIWICSDSYQEPAYPWKYLASTE